MTKVSVITPTHNPKYLQEVYQSLADQTHPYWEWIILPNAGAVVPEISDARIRVIKDYEALHDLPIGALKSKAASYAQGDIILELDHDDLLTPDALMEIVEAFTDQDVDFVYTNFAEFHDVDRKPHVYNKDYGWLYRSTNVGGVEYHEAIAPPAEPPYITNITHAPNHARAWRTAFYMAIGGHNVQMPVADDFDLVVRTYIHARKIKAIRKLLYLYRMFGQNTWIQKNQAIQEHTKECYHRYIIPIMLRWCADRGLKAIDLGAAHSKPAGFLGCDIREAPGVDYVFDMEKEWPFDDSSVGVIRCYDALEHISTEKKIHFFNEAWRVLAPGGALLIEVPSVDGNGAFMDPTHKSYWCVPSFWYCTMENYQRYVRPQSVHSFMVRELVQYFPSEFNEKNNIPYVRAHLFAVKDGGHPHPLPVPSMYPPKGWKSRPAGTVRYTPPSVVAEAPAIARTPVPPVTSSVPAATLPVASAPVSTSTTQDDGTIPDEQDPFLISENNLPKDEGFEKVLMKVDRSTPYSEAQSTNMICATYSGFLDHKFLPPFKTKWHRIESVHITRGAKQEIVSLVGKFVPREL